MTKTIISGKEADLFVSMRLKKRRIMLGISQQKLGKSLDLSVKQIQRYEDASSRVSTSILYFFAKLLNAPIQYFIGTTETIKPPSNDYFFDKQDNNLLSSIIAEDKEEYLAPLNITNKEMSNFVKLFTEVQSPYIRQKILDLVQSVVTFQDENQII
jgi:transcriptional regulator with XRE-family HTH domain